MPTPFLLLLTMLSGAEPSPSPPPSPRELLRNHLRASELTVVFGLDDPALERTLRETLSGVRFLRSESVRTLNVLEARDEDLSRGSLALVGSAQSNPLIARLLPQLPVQERAIAGPSDFLQLIYPNPSHPSRPLLLFAGGSDGAVLEGLDARRNADLHFRRDGKTVFLGFFEPGWELDVERSRVFETPSAASVVSSHFELYLHGVRADEGRAYADRLENVLLGARISRHDRRPVHVYPSLEDKGLVTGSTSPAHFEGKTLHAVFADGWRPEALVARDGIEEHLNGVVGEAFAEGLAHAVASDRVTLAYFDELAGRLVRARPATPLEDPSSFAREALTASWAGFVRRENAGDEPIDFAALEDAWRAWLLASPPAPSSAAFPHPPRTFLRGVNYTQEGFGIHDGYLSASSDRSLDKLVTLGADSVAIVPYAFMRDPKRVEPLVIPSRAGSETDQSIVHAIRAAKRRGMTVLLKPQIWIRRSWPGEIAPATERETDAFFNEYGKWIRHYALMADRHDVEMLAIGTELASLTHGRLARWSQLIRDVRAVYRGKLVYAANWGSELEGVDFWELLDYIGVDFYYPLSTEERATDTELEAGFERALSSVRAVAERYDRPVLLTEVGYASAPSPWLQPHASERADVSAPEDQARAYAAAFRAMADEGAWLRGTFWWKWPTTLDVGGVDDNSFTPNGKPAEEALREGYRRPVPP